MPGTKNSGNRTGKPRAAGAGRPPEQVTLKAGSTFVMLSQIWPNGDNADLGRGVIQQVRTAFGDHTLIIPQKDGSEIRIGIGQEDSPDTET